MPPEWLIVGLGNPGGEYAGTRHNVGFEVIERLASLSGIRLREVRFGALTGLGKVEGVPAALAKPLAFMNLSGSSVGSLARKFGLAPGRVLVVADDLDLPLGKTRLREGGGSGGHNGHKSIIQALGTEAYPRLKVGIGTEDRGEAVDHVLSRFLPSEREAVRSAIERSAAACEAVLRDGIEAAMRSTNGPSDAT